MKSAFFELRPRLRAIVNFATALSFAVWSRVASFTRRPMSLMEFTFGFPLRPRRDVLFARAFGARDDCGKVFTAERALRHRGS